MDVCLIFASKCGPVSSGFSLLCPIGPHPTWVSIDLDLACHASPARSSLANLLSLLELARPRQGPLGRPCQGSPASRPCWSSHSCLPKLSHPLVHDLLKKGMTGPVARRTLSLMPLPRDPLSMAPLQATLFPMSLLCRPLSSETPWWGASGLSPVTPAPAPTYLRKMKSEGKETDERMVSRRDEGVPKYREMFPFGNDSMPYVLEHPPKK